MGKFRSVLINFISFPSVTSLTTVQLSTVSEDIAQPTIHSESHNSDGPSDGFIASPGHLPLAGRNDESIFTKTIIKKIVLKRNNRANENFIAGVVSCDFEDSVIASCFNGGVCWKFGRNDVPRCLCQPNYIGKLCETRRGLPNMILAPPPGMVTPTRQGPDMKWSFTGQQNEGRIEPPHLRDGTPSVKEMNNVIHEVMTNTTAKVVMFQGCNVRETEKNGCENGSLCMKVLLETGQFKYRCKCEPPYYGSKCHLLSQNVMHEPASPLTVASLIGVSTLAFNVVALFVALTYIIALKIYNGIQKNGKEKRSKNSKKKSKESTPGRTKDKKKPKHKKTFNWFAKKRRKKKSKKKNAEKKEEGEKSPSNTKITPVEEKKKKKHEFSNDDIFSSNSPNVFVNPQVVVDESPFKYYYRQAHQFHGKGPLYQQRYMPDNAAQFNNNKVFLENFGGTDDGNDRDDMRVVVIDDNRQIDDSIG